MRIRLVTCRKLPEPDADRALLSAAMPDAEWVAWDDSDADWRGGLSVIRSTWNYYQSRDAFVAWAARAGREGRLFNPPEVVAWNSHKSYLADLAAAGFPVVPTVFLSRGSTATLAQVARDWNDVVIKPTVSAGSFRTVRARSDSHEGQMHLSALLADRDAMLQPYVHSVDDYGERSLIWIDGELTHAIRKTPRFIGSHERVSGSLAIAADERELAARVFARHGAGLLYGRLDLCRDAHGTPMIMELELIEPSLFLRESPRALTRLVEAIERTRMALV